MKGMTYDNPWWNVAIPISVKQIVGRVRFSRVNFIPKYCGHALVTWRAPVGAEMVKQHKSWIPERPVHKQVVCCKGCHHQLQILWLLHVLLYAVTDSHQLQIILRWTFPKILMLLTLLISTVRHLCSKLEPSRKSCWGTPWEQFYVTLEISSDITVGIS